LLGFMYSSLAFAIGGGPQPLGLLKNEMPTDMRGVGVTEHLGEKIDLSLSFKNEYDETVTLSEYFSKGKPVFLVLAYYECPTLCNTLLNSLFETFKQFEWDLGEKWEFVVVSIDPDENHLQA